MDISPKAPNNQDTICRPHEAQAEGRPKCGCFSFSEKGNKILTGANMEINSRAETVGKIIQRPSHLGIHSIYCHQTLSLLCIPRNDCWKEPDMAFSWEALSEPYKYRGRFSQSIIGLSVGSLVEELEKGLKELKGLRLHNNNNNINQADPPELPGRKPSTKEYTWLQLHM